MQDQFNEYVKSKGKEPSEITEEEKAELQNKMAGDLFPGKSSHDFFTKLLASDFSCMQGLSFSCSAAAKAVCFLNHASMSSLNDATKNRKYCPCK